MEAAEQVVRGFIIENFLFGDESRAPAPDESFLELGIIDSTGVLELVQFVEQTFGIKIRDVELLPENLDTIQALVSFVQRKTASS